MAKRKTKNTKPTKLERASLIASKLFTFTIASAKLLFFLFFAIIFLSFFGTLIGEDLKMGNVAVIPIKGAISTSTASGFVAGTDSASIVKLIKKAEKNDEIKATILEIDSPGGTPVASDEIAQAVKNAKKPIIAVIRETGASGAYWIATAADKIYANRMSVTGSIGVRASRLEFSGFIKDNNITYRRLVAGKYKDAGDRFKEMGEEEQKLFQKLLDDLHTEFIRTVATNRNLDENKVRELATGFVYLGSEAKELGLIDEIGSKNDALAYLEKELNITAEPVNYKKKGSFFEELTSVSSKSFYNMGKGIGSTFQTDPGLSISFT